MAFRCGFVALVGPTNSGKSTLINSLVGAKVSIVSPKPQTTYHGVRGILNREEAQIVFVDTPGFQKYPKTIPRLLNRVADQSAREADERVWVFDVSHRHVVSQIERMAARIQSHSRSPLPICILNKVDKIPKPELLPILEAIHVKAFFSEVIPISAKKGDGVERVIKAMESRLPEGIPLFPTDIVTDRPTSFLLAEYVREQIYRAAHEEIPYSVWVEIEEWKEEGTCPVIRAVIHVDAKSRRGILVGKGGMMLKRIGTEARKSIERLMGRQICLKLFVDVDDGWCDNSARVERYLELR